MKKDKWSRKYDKCQECGTTEIPHEGLGLCKRCYRRQYDKEYQKSSRYKEYHKKYKQSLEGKEAQKRYCHSQKGMEAKNRANKKYLRSSNGKEKLKIAHEKYFASQKGKAAQKKYFNSIKGMEAFRKHNNKYRTIKNGNYLWLPFYDLMWQWAKELTFGYCPNCREPFDNNKHKLTMDHIIPISKSGIHSIANVIPICLSCNCKKSDYIIWNLRRNIELD